MIGVQGGMEDGAAPGGAERGHAADDHADGGYEPADEAATPSTRTSTGTDTGTGTDIAITFKLYATLQDLLPAGTKRNAASIRVPAGATLNDIIDRFKVPRRLAHLVLVNGHFRCEADRDAPGPLKEGDVLAIWPPVAGG